MGLFDFAKKKKINNVEATENVEEQAVASDKAKETSVNEVTSVDEAADNDIDDTLEGESAVAYDASDDINSQDDITKDEKNDDNSDWFTRLKNGLNKTRSSFVKSIENVFKASELDDDFYEELEETLVCADIGIHTTENIIDDLKAKAKSGHIKEAAECRAVLIDSIKAQMKVASNDYDFENKKTVILVIGVNGVGKTTSIGKLASIYKSKGKKVLMCAADTFRAAATEQLIEWSNRAGVDIISAKEGADPSSVVFDAVAAFSARKADILLIDTAGRLHNKKNLMEELSKMNRIIDKELPDVCRENFIVLDASTGQNALVQAKEFKETAQLTGIILTKMDGTAKGGIAVAIQSELGIPVKYIGVGEKINDLQRFSSDDFVNALFD